MPISNPIARSLCVAGILAMAPHAWGALHPILEWDGLMLQSFRTDNTSPTLASRNLAILTVAMYDAVNSIERSHLPAEIQVTPPEGASSVAAAHAAGHEVMLGLFPTLQARTTELWERVQKEIQNLPGRATGEAVGREVGRALLENRQADGSNTQVPYIPSDLPGQWRRTPPFFRPPLDPNWRLVELFSLNGVLPFVPAGPPPMDSDAYAAAYDEVKRLGGAVSSDRTAFDAETARFWSDFSNTVTPPGHWHEIATDLVQRSNLSLPETARLFALIGMAQSDAAVVTWETKYHYNFWRPVTAIQRGDEDGNPKTEKDATWQSFLPSPPFPEYVSGHSTFSHASATVLSWFFGTDRMEFETRSDTVCDKVRTYGSLDECANEIGHSRVLGGIHFSFASADGRTIGRKIARYVTRNSLLPLSSLPLLTLSPSPNGSRLEPRLHTRPGEIAVVEASPDLIMWQSIATNSAPPGGWAITNAVDRVPDARFFRIAVSPQ